MFLKLSSGFRELAEFKPWFVEEPTSPDDILGHRKIAERCRLSALPLAKCATIA